MAQVRFSKVLTIDECSGAPNWSHMGVFSCHQCDLWREKIALSGIGKKARAARSARYQCTRKKSGQPLRVRIICKEVTSVSSVTSGQPSHVELPLKRKSTKAEWKTERDSEVLARKVANAKAVELSLMERDYVVLARKVANAKAVELS